MKPSNMLAASLLLNLVLICVVAFKLTPKPQSDPAPSFAPIDEIVEASGSTATEAPTDSSTPTPPEPVAQIQAFHWSQLEAPDYRDYIANLRAIGCPEETIRDLVIAEVNKRYSPQLMALYPQNRNKEYWKNNMFFGADPELTAKREAISKEKDDLLKALLGDDYKKQQQLASGVNSNHRGLDYIPEDKRDEAQKVLTALNKEKQAIYAAAEGHILPSDQKKIAEIYKKHRDQLSKILTPQELFDWEIRNSDTAQQMRFSLDVFEPSEEEFRNIFPIKHENSLSTVGTDYGSMTPEERKIYQEQAKKMNEQLKETLGPERYEEYQRSNDYSYQTLYKLGRREDIPKESINEVWEMKDIYNDARNKIMRNKDMSPEERNAAIREISQETQNSVKGILGEETFKNYKSRGGHWLHENTRNIYPPAP